MAFRQVFFLKRGEKLRIDTDTAGAQAMLFGKILPKVILLFP